MLNWEKINQKLEKERNIKWQRNIEILKNEYEEEVEETIDYIFTSFFAIKTNNISPKALGILYARFEVVPEHNQMLSVFINYINKNKFTTEGAQISLDTNLIKMFDTTDAQNLQDTNLIFEKGVNKIKILKNNTSDKYTYINNDLMKLIEYDDRVYIYENTAFQNTKPAVFESLDYKKDKLLVMPINLEEKPDYLQ